MRHCFALDLKVDPEFIARYEDYPREVWPEVVRHIRDRGVPVMEIQAMPSFSDGKISVHAKRKKARLQLRSWSSSRWARTRTSGYATAHGPV
ncbi:L-rhamnose mutarotase [Paraburkholderia silvatlantica]|uniref:L-rhamnose mutarotase n=1 Tax=Paraburkholderia silvatlantica TaxID=321895 RepID=UPI000D75E3C6|nr:L-rhamnose mutarotase [Paraburkholderia silvatlantica]